VTESQSLLLCVMTPYFIAFVILSVYGLHRGWLTYTYFRRHRDVPGPPPVLSEWPRVTIQLPIYNERYVIERLVNAVSEFDYPRELLDIQVLDDSTDDTQEIARSCVERHKAMGLPIRCLHRSNRTGFKAGALAEGLQSATGELIALFDADFLPGPDFLRRTVPYFADSRVGMVQTRWTFLNRNYSALTMVSTLMFDAHFVIDQGARSRSGVFFNFNGAAGVWRRETIEDAGGWHADTLSEDADLSYRALLRGWRFLYLPNVECPSELAVEMNGFKAQQARWAKGTTQIAKKILPGLLWSKQRARVKAEAFLHLTGYMGCPLTVVLSVLLVPALLVRLRHGWRGWATCDLLGGMSMLSMLAYFLVSQRILRPHSWTRSILYLPHMVAVGMGLSLRNTKAVLEAVLGIRSEFVRTPKFSIRGTSGSWHGKKYGIGSEWTSLLEIAFGLYFVLAIISLIQRGSYRFVPVLLPFSWGFLYLGVMSLTQRWWQRVRRGARQRRSLLPLPGDD